MLTNTSLMLLRLCGKYTHLMKDLKPIASDVFRAMTQLLDFYVIAVYAFFTKDLVVAKSRAMRFHHYTAITLLAEY